MDSQVVEADGDGADVYDGVDGAHLVEQHRVGCRAVRLGLRSGELAEDGKRDVLRALCETGRLDDGMDVRERAMRVVVIVVVAMLVFMLVVAAVPVLIVVPVAVLVFVIVVVLVAVPVLVAMLVLVAVTVPLVPFFPVLAKEPRHVVVVVLVLAVELHVEVAGVKAALCHAAHADLEAVDRQGIQRG